MEISKSTRTHLFYQLVIILLLFLGNGFEILLDRKVLLFFACVPIVCYQLVVLACCMELIPVPPWMSFLLLTSEECHTEEQSEQGFERCSSPVQAGKILNSHSKEVIFPEVADILPTMRRWEKSVMNLGATPKCYAYPQKSKSWMNLSDSRSSERLSSREGSVDTIASFTDGKDFPQFQSRSEKINREERSVKAKSWKTSISNFKDCGKSEFVKSYSLKEHQKPFPGGKKDQEESELEKSYSFPFRQKRLQSWLEMKEPAIDSSNQNKDVPYWQSVGYNLAVKYEARRRQRAILNAAKDTQNNEDSNSVKSNENLPESVLTVKPDPKKSSKSARMTKLKVGISNLRLKKKEETDDSNNKSNKIIKSALFKLKNKSSYQTREKSPTAMPEFPQFLSNERPLIFYPKYLPFEKERFENDVKNKMMELSGEYKLIQ